MMMDSIEKGWARNEVKGRGRGYLTRALKRKEEKREKILERIFDVVSR